MSNPPPIHNIGTRQRRQRRVMGIVSLSLAAVLAPALSVLGVGFGGRLLLAPLVFAGFVGLFQSREHTCVALAATGSCDLGSGVTRIEAGHQRRAARVKALGIVVKAVGATALVMLVVALIP